MAVARALGEERLSSWHNLIPDASVSAIVRCNDLPVCFKIYKPFKIVPHYYY